MTPSRPPRAATPGRLPKVVLLRYKGIVAWKEWPVEGWLETAAARDQVAGFLRATRPLSAWLDTNASPSATEGKAWKAGHSRPVRNCVAACGQGR